jgi:hypothetical protein
LATPSPVATLTRPTEAQKLSPKQGVAFDFIFSTAMREWQKELMEAMRLIK